MASCIGPMQKAAAVRATRPIYCIWMVCPPAAFQNWRDGLGWQDWRADTGRPLTAAEREELRRKAETARAERQAEEARRHAEAAARAEAIWRRAQPCTEHPYLKAKGVQSHGLRVWRGKLVIPVRDVEGRLQSLQFIDRSGSKKFLTGGKVQGCFFIIGEPANVIFIGEGYATCASGHGASGHAAVVAFDCGNLKATAMGIRAKFPSARLVLLADDDHLTIGNPGLAKAQEAAVAVNGMVAIPKFGTDRPDEATDFNDLAQIAGVDAVRRCIEDAISTGGTNRGTRGEESVKKDEAEQGDDFAPLSHPLESGTSGTKGERKLLALNIFEFLSREIPAREMLLSPILPTQGLVMLHSWRGVGKTHTAIGIAYAVASGGVFLRWKAPSPRNVLYLDGEMPARAMQERVALAAGASATEPPTPDHLRIITPDLQPCGMPNLASEEGRTAVEEWLADGCDLLVIDNISTLCRLGKENESESWEPMQTWLLDLRRRGISVLLVHHSGKAGAQRGTSKREDILDTVLSLKRPDDYEPTEGARFEVHLEKSRGIFGEEAAPFEARLETRSSGALWTMRDVEDMKLARAQILFAERSTVRDAAAELGISKSAAGRLKKKLEAGQ
jgi:putative DNA primase/helicase